MRLLPILIWLLGIGAAVAAEPLQIVVMDPLSKPLSCPCVEGYAQRDYQPLADAIAQRVGSPVELQFVESLEGVPQPDLVIGKQSVVVSDAVDQGFGLRPVARLTGKDGLTTQTGLLVVRSGDSAQTVDDLDGYRILFGPADCDEKHAAAKRLLRAHGIKVAAEPEISEACSDGACRILEWGETEQAATVISSYAQPLLEGCGTIQPGDLRVIGETEPVPFITAFLRDDLAPQQQAAITETLLAVGQQSELQQALETAAGFVAVAESERPAEKKN